MNSAATLGVTEEMDPLGRIKKITLLYNLVDEVRTGEKQDLLADKDTVQTVNEIYDTLTKENFIVDLFPLTESNVSKLFELKTDIIFNLCYGIGSLPKTEDEVVKILTKTGIPFTGAKARAIRLTTDKAVTKKIFTDNQIPTPDYQVFVSPDDKLDPHMQFPLIVKPKGEDCSFGIHNDAVVIDTVSLKKRLAYVLSTYNEPVLVEEYIEGRELNITVMGNGDRVNVLPISEIIFGESYGEDKKWKIVDFEAKWVENSANFEQTIGVCPTDLPIEMTRQIQYLGIKAYKSTGCCDYARVDLRLSNSMIPYFIEVNINPGIGRADGSVRSAKAAGFTYSGFLMQILREAILRQSPISSLSSRMYLSDHKSSFPSSMRP